MATDTESFPLYKVAVLCVVLGIIWLLRDALIRRPYRIYIAWVLGKITAAIQEGLKKEKERIFTLYVQQYQKQLNRDITLLEIGSGTVTNLAFVPQNTKVVCLEPNPYFRDNANENIKKQDNMASIETVQGYAEDMPFEKESFDVVVSTLVLCSVGDMKKCMAEIKRVLKPGGKFVFLEHVAFDNKWSWKYMLQVVINPVWQLLFDGCSTCRDTGAYIKAAGFSDVNFESFLHEPFLTCTRPCISGGATK